MFLLRWEFGQSKSEFRKPRPFVLSSLPVINLAGLLNHLKQCQSLQRIVIIGDFTVNLDVAEAGDLDWPGLVLACIISPIIDWGNCPLQIRSDHPAFQSYLGGSKSVAADRLDILHYRDMILFDTNVAKMPY